MWVCIIVIISLYYICIISGFAVSVSLTCYVYCTICRHCNGFQNTVTSVYKILNTSLIIDVSGMCLNKPHSGSDECRPLENVACWVWEKPVFGSSEKPLGYKSYLPLMQSVCVWQSTPDPSKIFSVQKWTQHTHPQKLCHFIVFRYMYAIKNEILSSFTH